MNKERSIRSALEIHATDARAKMNRQYMNTELEILGCSVPHIRLVAKEFADLNEKDLNDTWEKSNVFPVLYVLLIIYSKHQQTLQSWKRYKSWAKRIENWAHSDMLSSLIAQLVEEYPEKLLPEMKKWNQDRHPWKRRLSLTSLFYYSSLRRSYPPVQFSLELIEQLIDDDHLYVQKAVGWTLRECGNAYPKETAKFVKKHVNKLSSIAFTTATEKWDKKEKEPLKASRKLHRKKNTYAKRKKV